MTIQQLEYIVALDTFRHYVKAAEHCFVTQPTITTQVKKLEDEMGITVFDRSKTPLKPTPMGELIIAKAKTIISEMNHLKELVNTEVDSVRGTFTIGVIPTVSPYLIPQFAGEFSKEYPETVLNIQEMQSEDIIDSLKTGMIDIGILVTPIDDGVIREVPLYNEPFLLYAKEGHPILKEYEVSPSDIEQLEDLWLLSSGHCFRNQVLNICNSKEFERAINFQSGSIESLKKMVDNYGGYTLVPGMSVTEEEKKQVRPFIAPKPIREVSIVVHHSFVKEGLIDALRHSILNVVPKEYDMNDHFFRVKWR